MFQSYFLVSLPHTLLLSQVGDSWGRGERVRVRMTLREGRRRGQVLPGVPEELMCNLGE